MLATPSSHSVSTILQEIWCRKSKKEYRAAYKVLMKKEIKVLKAVNFSTFGTIHDGRTLQELDSSVGIDGGELVDVPWHVAKFLCDKAKGVQKKSKIVGAHLIGRIARHLGLGQDEMVDNKMGDSNEEAEVAEARRAQEED
ncbi:hypothetical protein Tco_0449869 [Tanacetum coccineum]